MTLRTSPDEKSDREQGVGHDASYALNRRSSPTSSDDGNNELVVDEEELEILEAAAAFGGVPELERSNISLMSDGDVGSSSEARSETIERQRRGNGGRERRSGKGRRSSGRRLSRTDENGLETAEEPADRRNSGRRGSGRRGSGRGISKRRSSRNVVATDDERRPSGMSDYNRRSSRNIALDDERRGSGMGDSKRRSSRRSSRSIAVDDERGPSGKTSHSNRSSNRRSSSRRNKLVDDERSGSSSGVSHSKRRSSYKEFLAGSSGMSRSGSNRSIAHDEKDAGRDAREKHIAILAAKFGKRGNGEGRRNLPTSDSLRSITEQPRSVGAGRQQSVRSLMSSSSSRDFLHVEGEDVKDEAEAVAQPNDFPHEITLGTHAPTSETLSGLASELKDEYNQKAMAEELQQAEEIDPPKEKKNHRFTRSLSFAKLLGRDMKDMLTKLDDVDGSFCDDHQDNIGLKLPATRTGYCLNELSDAQMSRLAASVAEELRNRKQPNTENEKNTQVNSSRKRESTRIRGFENPGSLSDVSGVQEKNKDRHQSLTAPTKLSGMDKASAASYYGYSTDEVAVEERSQRKSSEVNAPPKEPKRFTRSLSFKGLLGIDKKERLSTKEGAIATNIHKPNMNNSVSSLDDMKELTMLAASLVEEEERKKVLANEKRIADAEAAASLDEKGRGYARSKSFINRLGKSILSDYDAESGVSTADSSGGGSRG